LRICFQPTAGTLSRSEARRACRCADWSSSRPGNSTVESNLTGLHRRPAHYGELIDKRIDPGHDPPSPPLPPLIGGTRSGPPVQG
jgi:hypothetical protein